MRRRVGERVDQDTDFGENAFLSQTERENNCDSLFVLFVEIIRNSCGNCKSALMAVFKLLVSQ